MQRIQFGTPWWLQRSLNSRGILSRPWLADTLYGLHQNQINEISARSTCRSMNISGHDTARDSSNVSFIAACQKNYLQTDKMGKINLSRRPVTRACSHYANPFIWKWTAHEPVLWILQPRFEGAYILVIILQRHSHYSEWNIYDLKFPFDACTLKVAVNQMYLSTYCRIFNIVTLCFLFF